MNTQERIEAVKSLGWKYSSEAIDCVINCLENYGDDIDFNDRIWEEVDGQFIYYADAFNYLKDNGCTDFEEAFREGFGKNVCTVACYFLEQEIYDLLREAEIDY